MKKTKFFATHLSGWQTTSISYSGYGYGRHAAGMVNVYGYGPAGTFDYVVTYHRSKVILSMLGSGEWWSLDEAVRSNYSTNGYTTRVGITRASLSQCRRMHASHVALPDSGKTAHDIRVRLRKN